MLNNWSRKLQRITTGRHYYPEIDGIRFLAIFMVVVFHIHGYFFGKTVDTHIYTPGPAAYWMEAFLLNGNRGVVLFFVLSGFILCLPFARHYLLGEQAISLKEYYIRRITRIEPPYFIAVTCIFLLQLAMHVNPGNYTTLQLFQHYASSLFYAHDMVYHHVPIVTMVAWSLEIEVQFYLIAPLLFRILLLPTVARRLLLIALVLAFTILPLHFVLPFKNFYGYGQYFFAGMLLADFYVSGVGVQQLQHKWVIAPAAVLLVAICMLPIRQWLWVRVSYPFLIAFFYYLILQNPVLKKVFSYKFIPVIGGMCYSIYLLHTTIITVFGRLTLKLSITSHYLPNLLLQLGLLSTIILLVSATFYLFLERPFMRHKWMKKKRH